MGFLSPNRVIKPIDLAEEPCFELGGLRVVPSERAVFIGTERREIQPRVMKVLVALAQARPAVVSRDRLAEQCWDGLSVGEDALNRCILALRHLAREFQPPPFGIDTVPRIGHRLVERVAPNGSSADRPLGAKPWIFAVPVVALIAAWPAFSGATRWLADASHPLPCARQKKPSYRKPYRLVMPDSQQRSWVMWGCLGNSPLALSQRRMSKSGVPLVRRPARPVRPVGRIVLV